MKKITSLALVLALCLSLLPVTALAEEGESEVATVPEKRVITSVDDLMKFAEAVNKGDYNKQTEAVVSLETDLNLSGENWTAIGDGSTCFSGKFYGNGHTISNLDFSSQYNRDVVVGFFGDVEGATIADLTVTGKVDTIEGSATRYFGAIAAYAENAVISNCVSDIVFNNLGNNVDSYVGLCGYAENTEIEYCQSRGKITITPNINGYTGSGIVGGIVGFANYEEPKDDDSEEATDNSKEDRATEIRYCTNTADMTLNVTHGGGIVGYLRNSAKVKNCYSLGNVKVTNQYCEIGGLVGTVYYDSKISDSYSASLIDTTDYNGTLPSTRLGGIVGSMYSGTHNFKNNYYAKKDNVYACGNDTNVRDGVSAKSADDMKTEDFYKEIIEGGGNYRYEAGNTPLLPQPTQEVSFEITPADLEVVITVDGKEATNPVALENGAHNFTVTAKDCEAFSGEFTVSANPETHTQKVAMSYLPADYTAVDAAIKKAKALNESDYRNFDTVKSAIAAVVRGKNITQQAEVNAMAKVIEDAINGLVRKSSGSSSSGSGNTTTKTETTTNPDGSTTKTETKKDGSVTETTTGTDGSVTKTETKTDTKSDGSKTETKTETKTDADGNKTTSKTETTTDKSGTVTESKTETKTDADGTKTEVKSETKKDQNGVTTGTETVKETLPNGSTGTTTTTTDANGTKTEAVTTISSKAVDEAKKNDEAVTVPVDVKATEDSQTAPTVKVELPKNSGETKVEIPVSNVTPGTVVAVVKPDGTEEIVKDCIPTENGIQLAVEDNVTLKVFDNAKDFTDTKGHWAEPYIDFASARELLNGISEDTFAPEQPTTRAMMWTVLARQDDTDLSGGTTWYDKAQAWAKDSGVSDGTAPQANVTRAQMVTMLWRAAGSPAPQTMSSFADVSADAYYAAAVAWAAEQGITNGVSATQFQPNGACTRAQIAAFLYRASLEN